MPSSFSLPRLRSLVCLAGGALYIVGFFLPMLSESTPGVPGSAHLVYEWQVVTRLANPSVLASSLAILSLLSVLIVSATSVARVFTPSTSSEPRLALINDLAATWGLAIQLSLDFVVLQSFSMGTAHADIAWGFVVLLIGTLMIFGSAVRLQTTFTPLTCVLLAIGSVILGLAWVFFDFFGSMPVINLSGWLPLFALFAVVALWMTRSGQWATTALTLPLVMVSLYGLYYLLLIIGAPTLVPPGVKILTVSLIAILLNGGVIWLTYRLTRRPQAAEQRKTGSTHPSRQSFLHLLKSRHFSRRSFLQLLTRSAASVAIGGLFLKAYIWDDPSRQWLLSDLLPHDAGSHKLTLAPPDGKLLTDASGLNSSIVSEIRFPTSVADILQAISDARASNRKISLSGVRHSMGGQALGLQTLHLDMTHMDFVRYNDSDQTVTVGPGATWRQAQEALSPHGRAVRVMQDSNIFTIGGASSVNVHGKDPRFGSLIDTVNYFNLVTVDGKEVRCDRTQNSDLFSAVLGGYGVLGIITEINVLTTSNSVYAFSLIPAQTPSLLNMLESLGADPKNQLLEAHLSVDADHLLTDSLIYQYAEVESGVRPKDDLSGENSIWLRKIIFQASRASNFGKVLRWELEKYLTPLVEAKTVSRNTAMAVPVRFLQNPDPLTTDVLQEYFVPTERVNDFLKGYADLIRKHDINLLNVTVRKVIRDTNALVSYAQRDMYGFVVYYKVTKNSVGKQTLDIFTRELIDYLIAIGATYYLCYGSYYSSSQLTTMYPNIPHLFSLKARHDPEGLLTNLWYERYRP